MPAAWAAAGVVGAALPPEYGGRGLTFAEVSAVWQGLAEGGADAGTLLALSVDALLTAVPLDRLGTGEQRQRLLPAVARGERRVALSLLEPAGGAVPDATAVTSRRRPDGSRVLDGVRTRTVNADSAHHLLVTAADADPDGGTVPGSVTAFVLDREAPGLRIEPTEDGLSQVVFEEVVAPAHAVLGTPGAARRELLPLLLALDATAVLAPWLGVMRALTARAQEAAVAGRLFDRPVQRFQTVRFALADMATRAELSSGLLYRAAWQLDRDGLPDRQDAAVARLFVAQSARSVVADAASVLALAGRFPDPVAQQAARDVGWLDHGGSGTELARAAVAASVLGLG